jgi:endonuclease/exonuclease/phosphatase family metal-dependent hydrolase
MKKATLVFILFVICQLLSAQKNADKGPILRVLSFNILHGATTQNDFDLDAIAKVIIEAEPDLVALQEVDLWTHRAKNYDLVAELAQRCQMIPLFGRAMYYDGGEYGEAILSKYSFIQSNNQPLPYSPGHEPRAALEVVVELATGDTLAFIGTHLDHTRDDKDRVAQAKKIHEVFSKNSYPTILAGDLNDIPGSESINILEKCWKASYDQEDPESTYPSNNPQKKIDYVMYSPENRWKLLETKPICDPIASDHCAYLVVLELLQE